MTDPRSLLRHVAALYVQTGGAYGNLLGVDPWDEARGRSYRGAHVTERGTHTTLRAAQPARVTSSLVAA